MQVYVNTKINKFFCQYVKTKHDNQQTFNSTNDM